MGPALASPLSFPKISAWNNYYYRKKVTETKFIVVSYLIWHMPLIFNQTLLNNGYFQNFNCFIGIARLSVHT